MYCPGCGAEIDDSDKFCRECGRDVQDIQNEKEPTQTQGNQVQTKHERQDGDKKPELDIEPIDPGHISGLDLGREEKVFVNENPHYYRFILHYFFAGLFIVLGIPMLFVSPGFGFFLILVIGGGILFYVLVARQSSRFIVTDQRVINKSGIFNTKSQMVPLSDIASFETNTPLMGGSEYGNLSISTTTAGGDVKFRYLPNHKEVVEILRKLKEN